MCRVGEKFINNQGCILEIIEYTNSRNCVVQFNNKSIRSNIEFKNVKNGQVKNLYQPSVFLIGYLGEGNYCVKSHLKIYKRWKSMLERCYSIEYQNKHITYRNCYVVEEWHNFQNFAMWYEKNYAKDFQLDKDILFKGNKTYSPQTCCFVPQEINGLFIRNTTNKGELPLGVSAEGNKFRADYKIKCKTVYLGNFNTVKEAFQSYKTAKEGWIKEVANEWKEKIDIRVYQAMCAYQVEITD